MSTFVFNSALGAGNVDTISDFSVADDTIRLDSGIFAGTGADNTMLLAGAFRTGAGAADADDRIIYNSATGAVSYDPDGNGAGIATQYAILAAGLAMSNADFLIV